MSRISSANRRLVKAGSRPKQTSIPYFLCRHFSLTLLMTRSRTALNMIGLMGSPCFVPFLIWNSRLAQSHLLHCGSSGMGTKLRMHSCTRKTEGSLGANWVAEGMFNANTHCDREPFSASQIETATKQSATQGSSSSTRNARKAEDDRTI